MIHDSPSKLYCDAIPFSPSSSWLHEHYSPELLQGVRVVKGLQAKWGKCSRTVSFASNPRALACWNDRIATGLESGNIITLDAITGVCTSILSGHAGVVTSLAFSPDGTSLISGSYDTTINLWDIQTGGVVKTFHGHTDSVLSVSISVDNTTIASGSQDNTICLWDIQTGGCCHTICVPSGATSVSFSPKNPNLLLSASGDCTVQQWDTNGHQVGPAYIGEYATFSPDGTCFVSLLEGTATIQNSNSGAVVSTIPTLDSVDTLFGRCCFSPNGKFMAVSSVSILHVWNIAGPDPYLVETLIGHDSYIISLLFSSSLISSAIDGSIKFWRISTSPMDPVTTDSGPTSLSSTSIEAIKLHPNTGIATSIDLAGVVKMWDLSTGVCNASFHTSAGIHNFVDKVVDGRLILAWGISLGIYIWDTEKEKHLKKVNARSDLAGIDLRISGDGSKVFFKDHEHIQVFSTCTGEVMDMVKLEGEKTWNPLIVDDARVWIRYNDSQLQGWDFGTPSTIPVPLSDLPPDPDKPWLDFIHDPPRVVNTVTGIEIIQLPGRYKKGDTATRGWVEWPMSDGVVDVQCDGWHMVARYESKEVLILDFKYISEKT